MKVFIKIIVWLILYLVGGGLILKHYFGYAPFIVALNPLTDWQTLYNAFMYQDWVIQNKQDVMMILMFFLFYPVCLWFGMYFVRIPWEKLIPSGLCAAHPSIKEIALNARRAENERPKALPMTGWTPYHEDDTQTALDSADEDMTPMDENKPPVMGDWMTSLKELAPTYQMEIFDHVKLGDLVVPLVLATDVKAFLFELVQPDEVLGVAEEINKAAQTLKEQEPDSDVFSILVYEDDVPMNKEELEEQLSGKGVNLMPISAVDAYLSQQLSPSESVLEKVT